MRLENDSSEMAKTKAVAKRFLLPPHTNHLDINSSPSSSNSSSPNSRLSNLKSHNSSYDLASKYDPSKNVLNKSMNDELIHKISHFKPSHRKTNSLDLYATLNGKDVYKCLNDKSMKNLCINLIDDSPNDDLFDPMLLDTDRAPTLDMLKSNSGMWNYPIDLLANSDSNETSGSWSNIEIGLRDKYSTSYILSKDFIQKGYVTRKTVLKDGKKPAVKFHFYSSTLFTDCNLFCRSLFGSNTLWP